MTLFLSKRERQALRRCLGLLELSRGRVALSIFTGALGLSSAIALSGVAAWLIARAAGMPDVAALGVAPVMVRLFGISRSVLRYCERLVSHDTALRGMTALRTHLYEILAASRTDVLTGLRRGDVLSRVGSDVDAVGDLVVRGFLPLGVAATVGVISSVAMALVYPLAGVILALCLALAGIVGPLATIRSARAAELARQEQATDLAATVLTAIDGGSELSVAGRMPQLLGHLDEAERHLRRTRDAAARPAALAASIDTFAMGLAVITCIIVGVQAAHAGAFEPVWLAVLALLPLSAFEATANLAPAALQLVTSAGAAVRITELISRAEASTREAPSPQPLPEISDGGPRLVAEGLAIGWPGGPIIAEGIDLELKPGKRLAIVGPSGIGKTTLLLTLAGLIPPRAGRLTLDGGAPWGATRADVSSRITLTAEDAHVFDTSVLENLRVARGDLTPAEARALLERAGLGTWLASLPEAEHTIVSSDATTLSGGERRRLLLARALAAPAPLMLLDEPGEHLDSATADALVADLLEADPSRGVLLVTHRLTALSHADEVLVLDHPSPSPAQGEKPDEASGGVGHDGARQAARVRARGSHATLAATDAAYRWSLAQEGALL